MVFGETAPVDDAVPLRRVLKRADSNISNEFWLPLKMMGKRLFVVLWDGTAAGRRAAVAASMMSTEMSDNVLVVGIGTEDAATSNVTSQMSNDLKHVLVGAGTPVIRLGFHYVQIPQPEWTIVETLLYFVNQVTFFMGKYGSPVLVCGSAASREGISRLSVECIEKAKVPVLSCVGTAVPLARATAGRLKRVGNNGSAGVVVAVCVTSSTVSKRAFDTAVASCREGDTLLAFHVDDPDREMDGTPDGIAGWQSECDKVVDTHSLREGRFLHIPKCKSVKDHVLDFLLESQPDIVVMGSIELAKPVSASGAERLGSICAVVSNNARLHNTCVCVVKSLSL